MIVDSVRFTGYPAGTTRTNVYLISESLKMVEEKMAELYKRRDSIPR
jgi:hypothetical protein